MMPERRQPPTSPRNDQSGLAGSGAASAESSGPQGGSGAQQTSAFDVPKITLPKGGGAIRGIGEKFAANPVTGTGSATIPIATSSGRSGFGPQLALTYDSGAGNGPFGVGWMLANAAITRKTDKGLPRYRDAEESDVFILSGAEDLVPVRNDDGTLFKKERDGFRVHRYQPRIEGAFARIERWTELATGEVHWRKITPTNLTTIYGKTAESRIADPDDDTHVFSWLVCESYDDKGNAIVYEYVAEDSENIDARLANERNRDDKTRGASRYLKHIKYGNRVSRLIEPDLSAQTWLFEVVFDYDEQHTLVLPGDGQETRVRASIDAGANWAARPDPFSRHRSGFELRWYRRCQRVLMFHRFEELGDEPVLIRSTEFDYADFSYSGSIDGNAERVHSGSTRYGSFIRAVTQSGYIQTDDDPVEVDGITYLTYRRQSMPPAEFEYSQAIVRSEVEDLDTATTENLPVGINNTNYQWIDLDGEGLSGVLIEQAGNWFYKRNESALPRQPNDEVVARFAPLEPLATLPRPANLGAGQFFADLAGDGRIDVVDFSKATPGFFERTEKQDWSPFRAFESLPTIPWLDPNTRFVDLTGDGLPDILISEHDVLTWHPSLAEQGFAAAEKMRQALDEEKGPRVVFNDGTESIYLADMVGDGLVDIVRIRNGEVCYWPNLGYGRFGAKVTMDNSPWFDAPDQFDQRRIRVADIDGSGVVDIIYLHRDGARLYFNQCGNRWADTHSLNAGPRIDNVSDITVVDLLGNGTACLVWSSPLPHDARRPMRYVRLMEDKPHLLIRTRNNLGAEMRVRYAPSTKFYLQDKAAGKPWVTRLPFPVHVVEHVETIDHISRNRFTTRYAYHHGYFDGIEREFRGFAMVEQWDTEAYEDYVVGVAHIEGGQELAPELYQPPVLTRRWFHTGAYLDGESILHQLRDDYYPQEQHLPDTILPATLDAEELRQCVRALKGTPLRTEVYGLDGSTQAEHPYAVTENSVDVQLVQHQGAGKHAVFLPLSRETVSYFYERNPSDPRIAHNLNLEYGPFGNVVKSAAVVYGRQTADASLPAQVTKDQQQRYIAYTEIDYTDDIIDVVPEFVYRLRVPYETRGYEITGVAPTAKLFTLSELTGKIAGTNPIAYEAVADDVTPQKRPLAHNRTVFLDDDLNPLPLGEWDTLGLVSQGFRLAFTPSVVTTQYAGHVSHADFIAAGYVHFNGDMNWWIPSGRAIFPADPAHHFYIPIGARDPYGIETRATLDQYDLLTERVRVVQAAWNETVAVNDYRVLGAVHMTDPNGNRAAVEIDALGMVVKSAVMGKPGTNDGDTLDDPTLRMEYEIFNWIAHGKPNCVHTFAREQHGNANTRWREGYVYSNGSGGIAMVKSQAHPGKALSVDDDGNVTEVDADPRWIGNGRTVLNNKGQPVKQYEPYFSITHEYEDEQALRELGATPVLYYDAVGRNIRTLRPDGTLARVELTPWMMKSFDLNDTVKESQWYADRGSPDPTLDPEPLNDPERRAAWLAAKHADTPTIAHLDSLGRTVYAVSDYGGGKTATVRTRTDLTGRYQYAFDQLQREVANNFTGMAGTPITASSAEKGRRWTFVNIFGVAVKVWDEHGREFRSEFDNLRRLISAYVKEAGQPEVLFQHIVYGDRHPNAEQLNLFGMPHLIFDQAGMVRVPELDFKGTPKRAERMLARNYQTAINWSTVAAQADYNDILPTAQPALETGETFTAAALYDALGRPTRVTLPDGTIVLSSYNAGGFLSRLQAQIRGQGGFIDFLREQDYDVKGQRQYALYGNNVYTRYFYDAKTFRLTQLLTHAMGADPETDALQDLHYTYDPHGNITQVRDNAQQTHYFNNAVVKPESLYEYDAIYHLIRASGRELAGGINDSIRTHTDLGAVMLPHANNTHAVRTYTEEYEYDLLGNIKMLRHRFKTQLGVGSGWTRFYRYAYQDDAADRTNRLKATSAAGDPDAGPYSATYSHDVYGNMVAMPHLATLDWNFLDQLREADLGGGGTAFYVYDTGGQRLRKVIHRNGNLMLDWIFLGPVMIHRRRRRDTGALRFERWTVHLTDNCGAIAQADTKTRDDDNIDPDNALDTPLIRYQHGQPAGAGTLETDTSGDPISYEEYHPFGTSAYRSAKSGYDMSLKRFRFSGKERDDETGLDYVGTRYYAPWLGRWTSADPGGFVSGLNLYRYCHNSPVMYHDPNGMDDERGNVYAPTDSPLRDPRNEASARAYLEGVYTSRLIDQSKVFVIDRMHYVSSTRSWAVDAWHLADRPAESDAGGEEAGGEGGEAAGGEGGDEEAGAGGEGAVGEGAGGEDSAGEGAAGEGDGGANEGGPGSEAVGVGGAVMRNNPAGNTIEVPDSVDDAKLNRLREGVRQRTVGRNTGPANPTRARRTSPAQRQALADFNTRSPRPSATSAAGHRIDMQYDLTGRVGEHWRDYIWEDGATNTNDGFDGYRRLRNQPQGRPAGGVARSSEMGGFRNSPRYRTGMRWGGAGLTGVGIGFSGYGLYNDIVEGDVPMGIGDALGVVGGGLELYAVAAPGASTAVGGVTVGGLAAMPLGIALSGAAIAITSGVSGYRAHQRGDTAGTVAGAVGVVAGTALAAGGTIALLSAAGVAMAPALVAAAPVLIAVGAVLAIGVGVFHAGRYFNWW